MEEMAVRGACRSARMKKRTDKAIAKLLAQSRAGSPSWSNEGAPAITGAAAASSKLQKVVFCF